jgi:multiple sugar transport system ATP-binding protein
MNFFEVTVAGYADKLYLDWDSFHLPVPASKTAMLIPHQARKITLGIRPEDIHDKEYVPAGIDASAMLRARVDVIEMMGNELFIYLVNNKRQFLARVDPRAKARPGQDMELVFDLNNLHAFDTKSEKAISGKPD